jgi:hypothetical protein
MPDIPSRECTGQNYSDRERHTLEGSAAMAGNNPWFLITLEEIGEIERQLQEIRNLVPLEHRHRVWKISTTITNVRDRLA